MPGTLFLIAFQVVPVLYTATTAFTNFGDGHRGTKDEAIVAIQSASVKQVPGSTDYPLTIATDGDPATGTLVFLLGRPGPAGRSSATPTGSRRSTRATSPSPPTRQDHRGRRLHRAELGQASAAARQITDLHRADRRRRDPRQGLSPRFEGSAGQELRRRLRLHHRRRDRQVVDRRQRRPATSSTADGERLAQGWKVNVGFNNFTEVFTDPTIAESFLRILRLELRLRDRLAPAHHVRARPAGRPRAATARGCAGTNALPVAADPAVRHARLRDAAGLAGHVQHRLRADQPNCSGSTSTGSAARGRPGSRILSSSCGSATRTCSWSAPARCRRSRGPDRGGRRSTAPSRSTPFRTITFPLLLVALAPLLIASFAFNFNNFNAIYLTTEGGPFPPDNPTAGATDLLITYTYRLAFGGQGAQYGFAAAISILIFLIVAVVSIVGFRRTQALEEIN